MKITLYSFIIISFIYIFNSDLNDNVKSASAFPSKNIDLTKTHNFPNYWEDDPRWADQHVGPLGIPQRNAAFAECGCFITALASVITYYTGHYSPAQADALGYPLFPVPLTFYTSGVDQIVKRTEFSLNFYPNYINQYLQLLGGAGYKNTKQFCDTLVRESALLNVASPAITPFASPVSGIKLNYLVGKITEVIDKNLEAGKPTLVTTKGNIGHTWIIVGYNSTENGYKVVDPLYTGVDNTGPIAYVPKIPSADRPDISTYQNWWNIVSSTIDIQPTSHSISYILTQDDPAPFEMLAYNPDGHKTGYNPETKEIIREDPTISYAPLVGGGWSGPFGANYSTPDEKSLAIANPQKGTYRLEIIGTASGKVNLTNSLISLNSSKIDIQQIEKDIIKDQNFKYELDYSPFGNSTISEVSNFKPEARVGNENVNGLPGFEIKFDASLSFDVDGNITLYSWNFGDNTVSNPSQNIATGIQASHYYNKPGIYNATLTITDDKGATDTATVEVIISDLQGHITSKIDRVSVSPAQGQATERSFYPALSSDGRYVAFESLANNLVQGDTNQLRDIFIRDLQTDTTERVSISNSGAQSNAESYFPSINADGRYVAFYSRANLVSDDTNNAVDVYVRDRLAGITERVSVSNITGIQGYGDSIIFKSSISADGRYVAFSSIANNLVSGDTNAADDIFVRDRLAGTTERVSVSSNGEQTTSDTANWESEFPSISADGRYVAFYSYASNLVSNDTDQSADIFVRDLLLDTTEIVSISETYGNLISNNFYNSISADGRYVAFDATITNPLNNDVRFGLFIRDRVNDITELGPRMSAGQPGRFSNAISISADGSKVAYQTTVCCGILPEGIRPSDIFVYDRTTNIIERVSNSITGELGNHRSEDPSISADGRYVAFDSGSSNLVLSADTNRQYDIFVRDLNFVKPIANPSGPYVGWALNNHESGEFIEFDGSNSIDPVGMTQDDAFNLFTFNPNNTIQTPIENKLTAKWDFGDGTPIAESNDVSIPILHSYENAGKYNVTLVVSNGRDESLESKTTVEVLPPIHKSQLQLNPSCGNPGTNVSVSGTEENTYFSLVNGGWNLANGPLILDDTSLDLWNNRENINIPVRFPDLAIQTQVTVPSDISLGNYMIQLPEQQPATFTVPCPQPDNFPPNADAGGPYISNVNIPVSFDGSDSTDPEGDQLTYFWNFGDSLNGTGPSPQHVYNNPGEYIVKLTVSDGNDSSTLPNGFAKVTITNASLPVNNPPVARDSQVMLDEDTSIPIQLIASDLDVNDNLTYSMESLPVSGKIINFDSSTGSLVYEPDPNLNGNDGFLFKVVDQVGLESNIATVLITVNPVNDPPVANNQQLETDQNASLQITLSGADHIDNDAISQFRIVNSPTNGQISNFNPNTGTLTYIPNNNFAGQDSFTFKVTDSRGLESTNTALVMINVKSIQEPPNNEQPPLPLPSSVCTDSNNNDSKSKGTQDNDDLIGTSQRDTITGLGGNDRFNGCSGDDTLNGNSGNDGIAGGPDDDNLHGNEGNDYLQGDTGSDSLYGNEGNDILVGNEGRDKFFCGSGQDKILDFDYPLDVKLSDCEEF